MTTTAEQSYWTVRQTAQALRIHENTVRNMLADGRIHGVRAFNRWRIPEAEGIRLQTIMTTDRVVAALDGMREAYEVLNTAVKQATDVLDQLRKVLDDDD